jgi:cytochrome c biogenesis protein
VATDLEPGGPTPAPAPARTSPGPALPELGTLGLLRWAWRQLTSMRTALQLLLLLAVAAVPGSVFPQRGVDPNQVTAYLQEHPELGPWLDRAGLFDVYSSVWFSAIYLLLFVSLVGCVLPRSRQHWAAVRAPLPRLPSRLERLPEYREVTTAAPVTAVASAATSALRSRRYRAAARGEEAVAAERGHWRETGNLVFHLSLVGLLVAVAAGHLVGYRGEALVVVGRGFSNTLPAYDAIDPGTWFDAGDLDPFSFELDELRVRFEESAGGNQFGAPRDFAAEVTVRDTPGGPARTEVVRVNEPLSVRGTKVFLSGNGYAPVVTVRDGTGEVVFSEAVVFLPQDGNYTSQGVVKVPDISPEQLGLIGFLLPTAAFDPETGPVSVFPDALDPRLALTAFTGDLGLDDGVPQNAYQLDTERMEQLTADDGEPARLFLAPGETVDLPDGRGSVTFERVERFAALDVRRDPATTPALVFALLAIAGLTLSLFVPRRRLWVRAVPGPDGRTVVHVAGLARGSDAGLAGEVDAVAAATVRLAEERS